jgi:hypothetical protein
MRCEVCQGAGMIRTAPGECSPCYECNQFAIIHCCEGLREQPEPEEMINNQNQSNGSGR